MSVCATCRNPLTIAIDGDGEGGDGNRASSRTVPDDVELSCGCHYHWQCLLDAYTITECPVCGRNITSSIAPGEQQVLCNLLNEGGPQENVDILPLLKEESYLRAYPEERKCRAFLEFCREGDIEAIVDLLNDDEDDDDEDEDEEMDMEKGIKTLKSADILRYQDPIGDMSSGLQIAVLSDNVAVVWLLLFLASSLELHQFPAESLQAAEQMGISRIIQAGQIDIRALKDAEGCTAEALAAMKGGIWNEWLGTGRLRA
ncbi:hypothetical protein LPUS_10127 [Lasallia pustulata]|uniref:Uncharacterized protein n=1 Tax=Lasallia pustulata TaxID=136370 RepID=A0A1W5D8U7_9LECA|nr:hypothetical protein LPUS_10127 [Lasallia pustulata]